MDQKLIGEFLSTKRKEKGLTQKELADKLRISEKTISKWETGHGLPEVSNMQPLCKELDITVTELLNGKESKDTKPVIEYMEYKEKKTKKKMLITVLLSTLLIALIIVSMCLISNFNKVAIYELTGESEHFEYHDGLVMQSNIKYLLVNGRVDIKGDYIKQEDLKEITIYSGKTLILGKSAHNFTGYSLEDYGYGELLTEEKMKNIDNWYLIIRYQQDGKTLEEKIPLKNKLSMKNNKIFYKKDKPIGKDNGPTEREIIKTKEQVKEYNEYFLKKGYKKTELDQYLNAYEKEIDTGTITIFFETSALNLRYEYRNSEHDIYFKPEAQYYSGSKNSGIFFYYWRKDNTLICHRQAKYIECPKDIKEDVERIVFLLSEEFKEIIPSKEHWKSKE